MLHIKGTRSVLLILWNQGKDHSSVSMSFSSILPKTPSCWRNSVHQILVIQINTFNISYRGISALCVGGGGVVGTGEISLGNDQCTKGEQVYISLFLSVHTTQVCTELQ